MKNLKVSILAFFFALSLFSLDACTVKKADNEITMPDSEQSIINKPSLADEEMDFAYGALYFFYLDAAKRLKDIKFYINKGEAAGFSSSNYEYPDIYNMFSQMGDEYTYYVGPYYAKKSSINNMSEPTYDIGIQVDPLTTECESSNTDDTKPCETTADTKWLVTQVYQNAPGDKAGLLTGDTILLVGSTNPRDETAYEKLTSGVEGDTIPLKVARGDTVLDIQVILSCYLAPTVYLSYKDSIPIIRITEFDEQTSLACDDAGESVHGTTLEFENMLKKTKGPTIIDLRDNPGGDISQCVSTTKATLAMGDTLFTFKSADFSSDSTQQAIFYDDFVAENDGVGKGRYYVLLADSTTASCAEMMILGMTSALKSPIVGKTTYGKGIGQYYFTTPAQGYSVVTSTKVLDKSGNSYHDLGFIPDYEIADSLKVVEKAVALAKEGKEKRTHGYGSQRLDHFSNIFAKKTGPRHEIPRGGAYKIIKDLQMK